jgi:hypothetical protein
MFTTALVAVFSLILLEVRRGQSRKWLLALPALMVAWVNLHGGYLVGFILIGAFTGDQLLRWTLDRSSTENREMALWLLLTLFLSFLASLLNPAGLELWPHTTGYLGETYLVAYTQEYQSPNFHDAVHKSFLAALTLGTIVLALLRSRVDPLGLVLWVLFAAFALHSVRNIPLFAAVCIPWLAAWTCELVKSEEKPGLRTRFWRWANAIQGVESTLPGWPIVLFGLLLLTIGALGANRSATYAFARHVFPVAAVDQLQESGFVPPGPVYNDFIWGGYLLYAWPEIPVFIDGQTDFYGEELTKEYVRIRNTSPDWDALLEKHRVRWAIIPPEVPLNQALTISSGWQVVYSDSTAVVWTRTDP